MDDLRGLWTAYLEEGAVALREIGYEEDVPAVVAEDLASATRIAPPDGRLLLAIDAQVPLGTGAVRRLASDVAEIKRMYLRPEGRGKGIGRALLTELLGTARRMGCREARLDTGWFMSDAHRLYHAPALSHVIPTRGVRCRRILTSAGRT